MAGQQPVNYVSGITYAPHSAPQSYVYGNQLARSYAYNIRLQTQETTDTAGGTTLLDLLYGWDGGTAATRNNGSLRTQQIGTNAGTFAQGFGYDALNRLTSVTDNGGGGANQRNYAYDAYGNAAVSGNTGTFPMSPLTPGAGTTFTNNQLPSSLATYDAAGNAIGLGSCTNCLAYDAENRQVAAALNGGTTSYGYDGAGNRVLKTTADGTVTVYVYDALNQLIAEYTSAAVAPAAPCQTCYLSWDQLGSTRLVTDAGGNVIARHDYLPFGEEIGAGNAGRPSGWGALDAVDQKFTGQERDDESHLDFFEARYYGSAQARFNSPDPMNAGADLYNPQSWNGYAYVMNTPLSAVDPDGLDSVTSNTPGFNASGQPASGNSTLGNSLFAPSDLFGWSWGGGTPKYITLQNSPYKATPQSKPTDEPSAPSYVASWGAALNVLGDFIGGFGPTNRIYGPSSVDVGSFLMSKGASQMNSLIRRGILSGALNGNNSIFTDEAALNVRFDFFHSPVGLQVGAFDFDWTYIPYNSSVAVRIRNEVSLRSFGIHILSNRDRLSISSYWEQNVWNQNWSNQMSYGTIYQELNFTEGRSSTMRHQALLVVAPIVLLVACTPVFPGSGITGTYHGQSSAFSITLALHSDHTFREIVDYEGEHIDYRKKHQEVIDGTWALNGISVLLSEALVPIGSEIKRDTWLLSPENWGFSFILTNYGSGWEFRKIKNGTGAA